MSKKHEITLPAEQASELMAPIVSVVMSTQPTDAQYWISRKRKFEAELRNLICRGTVPFADLIAEWEKFYLEVFGLDKNFSSLRIPKPQEGFSRPIIEAGEITNSRVFAKCKELFPARKYADNLDTVTNITPWTPGDRAYWIRDRVEADEELKNISTNNLANQNIVGITLKGRLLFEVKYFKETGQHLDIQNITLCSGSRDAAGDVPSVRWNDDELHVGWTSPGIQDDRLRSRAVVS
ncbi:MAG: hypothetical protein ABIJ81_03725 [Patescibacteria group bacterium]